MNLVGSMTLTSLSGFLPVGIGCLVGMVVLTCLGIFGRGRCRSQAVLIPVQVHTAPDDDGAGHEPSFANRRNSLRREGRAVKVQARSQSLKGLESGLVLDRSTGGLRLALGVPVPPGSAVEIRARNAPDSTPWVTVIVRSCRPNGKQFELGCEFDSTPPWNVLLLFG